MKIKLNYPGANILVNRIEDHEVFVEQDLRDTDGWWFYWNFAIEDFSDDKPVIVHFTNGEVVGPWGPAFSTDRLNWKWLGADSLNGRDSFKFIPSKDCKRLYFSFSIPYQLHNFSRLVNDYIKNPIVSKSTLCLSEQDRPIPVLTIGSPDSEKNIIFTARHHACESIGSYVLEGTIRAFLEREDPLMYPILRQYRIHVIPFVDLDGVENGDQGKNRRPHDHNRDYTSNPIYNVTSAIMKMAEKMEDFFVVDFHSLYKWGGMNDHPLIVRQPPPHDKPVIMIGSILRQLCAEDPNRNSLVYEQIYDKTPFITWNGQQIPKAQIEDVLKDETKTPVTNCSSYFVRNGASFAFSFETPYFGTRDHIVTRENAIELGRKFARALELFVMN